jgi:hypothetical protein
VPCACFPPLACWAEWNRAGAAITKPTKNNRETKKRLVREGSVKTSVLRKLAAHILERNCIANNESVFEERGEGSTSE